MPVVVVLALGWGFLQLTGDAIVSFSRRMSSANLCTLCTSAGSDETGSGSWILTMLTVSSFFSFSMYDVPQRLARRLPPLTSVTLPCAHLTASEWLYAWIRSSPPMSLRNWIATGMVMYDVKSAVPFQSYCRQKVHGWS